MKPGGMGNPSLVISARPAPLPPSRILFLPSASSKKYIGLTMAGGLPRLPSSDICYDDISAFSSLKRCARYLHVYTSMRVCARVSSGACGGEIAQKLVLLYTSTYCRPVHELGASIAPTLAASRA